MNSRYDRSYLVIGLSYGGLGMAMGIHMAATLDHSQAVTHAHLLLVGFLLSMIYAIIHRLWLQSSKPFLAGVQFATHHLGVIMMVSGLFLLYGGYLPHAQLEPLLASASIVVLVSLLLMIFLVVMPSLDDQTPAFSSEEEQTFSKIEG